MAHQSKFEKDLPATTTDFFAPELRVWRGIAPLSVAFWFYGVLVSWILIALYAATVYRGQVFIQQTLLICFAIYTTWILISIWRCSLAVNTFWSLLAKLLTVAWAANVALVLLFLQTELVITYIGS